MKVKTSNPRPNPPSSPPPPPTPPPDPGVNRFVDSFRSSLPAGQSLSFEFSDGRKFSLENTPEPEGKSFAGLTQFIQAAAQEIQVAVNAGPSLALTGITEVVKPLLLNGVPEGPTGMVEQWYGPAVRGVSILLSLEKFLGAWRESHAPRKPGEVHISTIDYAGMAANGIHVLTCTAGLAGAIAGAINPNLRHLAAIGKGVGVAGDIGAFAVNWMSYAHDRSKIADMDAWANPNPKPKDDQTPPDPPSPNH